MSLKPIEDWVPSAYVNNINLVVGVEYDKLDGVRWRDWTLDLQFCTWAIMSKPGHHLMKMTVDRVIARLKALAREQGTTISGIRPSFVDVLNTTGPALFTETIIEGLAYTTGTNFTWQSITGITKSRLVGDDTYVQKQNTSSGPFSGSGDLSWGGLILRRDFKTHKAHLEMATLTPICSTVLILPIKAFEPGQMYSKSGSPDDSIALVQHRFKGSWKVDHPFRVEAENTREQPEAQYGTTQSSE